MSETDPLEPFNTVCTRLAGFDPNVGSEWADGYLTAVAACPRPLALAQVLPHLAGDAFERCFSDPADAEQAHQVFDQHLQALRDALNPEQLFADPDVLRLSPLLVPWDDEARQQAVEQGLVDVEGAQALVTGADWVAGFFGALYALGDHFDDPTGTRHNALFDDLALAINILRAPLGSAELTAHLKKHYPKHTPSRDQLIDDAMFAVQDLRVRWLDLAVNTAPLRAETTPGRNDPCPCGSGKKYKKCHGANG